MKDKKISNQQERDIVDKITFEQFFETVRKDLNKFILQREKKAVRESVERVKAHTREEYNWTHDEREPYYDGMAEAYDRVFAFCDQILKELEEKQ
jgi:hypothetical protein